MRGGTQSVLKLTDNERAVYTALRRYRRSESVTHIAMSSDLPRTTTAFTLWSLASRGLAERTKVNQHWEWQRTRAERVTDAITTAEEDLAGTAESGHSALSVTTYRGIKNIAEVIKTISSLSKGERVYGIQGNLSAERGLKKLGKEYLAELHRQLRDRQVVINGIVGKSALRFVKNMTTDELRSHLNRLVVAHVVPDEYLNFDCDLYVMRDTVVRVQYGSLFAEVVKDPDFAASLKGLIAFVEAHAEKVDLNAEIKSELRRRGALVS
ncbi:MAG: hypothetical protein AAB955_02780 [Patescibacteria group bacterium]